MVTVLPPHYVRRPSFGARTSRTSQSALGFIHTLASDHDMVAHVARIAPSCCHDTIVDCRPLVG